MNDNAFLVLAAAGCGSTTQALAQRIRDGIRRQPFAQDGMPQHLDVAIGHAALSHGADTGSLLDSLEQAARSARGVAERIALHAPGALEAGGADGLAAAMRRALQERTLELAFQPVVAVAGGEEAQFQVLLRLRDAAGTVHRAGTLVPAAERAGLMPDIDRWVLEQSVELLRRRRAEHRSVRLFVSQSPRTLARDGHAEWLRAMLASHEVEGTSLVIDLRLADALVHSVTLRAFCDLLMPTGVQFCLSQFLHGTEADALLDSLPLGYVRLSPRYSDAHADPALRDELRGVIDRAHRLGLQVIGPQVENAQSAAMLWMSGIDLIQGNLVQQADEELEFDFQHAVL